MASGVRQHKAVKKKRRWSLSEIASARELILLTSLKISLAGCQVRSSERGKKIGRAAFGETKECQNSTASQKKAMESSAYAVPRSILSMHCTITQSDVVK